MIHFALIIGISVITIQSALFVMHGDTLPLHVLMTGILSLTIYFFISIYGLFRTNQLELTKKRLEKEELDNKTLNILYDSVRMFKHDFNNIVQSIGGYVAINNMEGLKSYYSQLLDDCQRLNSLTILSPEIINNPAVYSLITSKYYTADELGITINVESFLDLTKINMKIYELSRILGILLDNAIEASKQSKEKIINIIIKDDIRSKRQLFIVENTYNNKDINLDTIFEKGFTSKKDADANSHGLGLWEIRQILKRNNNLNLHTTKNEQFFTQQFEIY
ncbi:MAG: GHKL domain-containing protein [Oscillospiraceae bacterium]|nr:GHKL domain-containing protein [Oscillospiraceae bacterium]